MNALAVIDRCQQLGIVLIVEGENIRVRKPIPLPDEIREALRANKPEVIELLEQQSREPKTRLGKAVAERAPTVHFTVWETDDAAGDVAWLREVRRLIEEFDGMNKVIMNLHTPDGKSVKVQWHALATKAFRRQLATLLLDRARVTGHQIAAHTPERAVDAADAKDANSQPLSGEEQGLGKPGRKHWGAEIP